MIPFLMWTNLVRVKINGPIVTLWRPILCSTDPIRFV